MTKCTVRSIKLACMAKRRRFEEPYHVGAVYVGHNRKDRRYRVAEEVIERAIDRVATKVGSGGATTYRARGTWKRSSEDTSAIEVLAPASRSCEWFTRSLREIGRITAREAQQEAVTVAVQCAGRPLDVTFEKPAPKKQRRSPA